MNLSDATFLLPLARQRRNHDLFPSSHNEIQTTVENGLSWEKEEGLI